MKKSLNALLACVLLLKFNVCLATSFPNLVTIEDLLNDPVLARLYYEDLKVRFRNGDFEEILFVDDQSARSARLNSSDYERTLKTLKAFFEKHPEELGRMQEVASQRPFSISSNGQVSYPTLENLQSWETIPQNFSSLGDSYADFSFLKELDDASIQKILTDIESILSLSQDELKNVFSIFNKSHQHALFEALKKEFNRKRSPAIKKVIADTLLVAASGPARLERIQDLNMDSNLAYYTFEDIEKDAVKIGKIYQLPGNIVDSLRTNSSFKEVGRSNFFRKGTTIVPMSRGEGIFKGVGPGECVRSSCNRYFDAFFEDAEHMKILKDGKETGYIGIYKVVDKNSGMKYWYIETIQSPLLVSKDGSGQKVRGIIKHLQQLAIKDNSLLVLPSTSYNSFNYKEVIGALAAIPETATGEVVETEFRSEKSMEKYREFKISELSDFDQVIAANSGYEKNILTNGFTFNGGKLSVVGFLQDQPDWYLVAYDELKETGEIKQIDPNVKLSIKERIDLFLKHGQGYKTKKYILDLVGQLENEGQHGVAAEVRAKVYNTFPNDLRGKTFAEQLEYVEHQINNIVMDGSLAQELKDELTLKAKTWEEYKAIVNLGDKEGKYFGPFFIASLNEFSDKAPAEEIISIFKSVIQDMPSEQFDMELIRKIAPRIETPDQFIDVLKAARGEGVQGYIKETARRQFVIDNWERFYNQLSTWDARFDFGNDLLDRVDTSVDFQIRMRMFKQASNIEEVKKIMSMSSLYSLDEGQKVILSRIVSDKVIELIELGSVTDYDAIRMNLGDLENYLVAVDEDRIKNSYVSLIKTLEDFESIKSKISTRDLLALYHRPDISDELKSYIHPELKKKAHFESLLNSELGDFESAFDIADKEDIKQTLNYAKKNKLKAYISSLEASQSPNVLKSSDAKSLSIYLNLVADEPVEFQKELLASLTNFKGAVISDLIPNHKELRETLEKWGQSLENQGIESGKKKIFTSFSSEYSASSFPKGAFIKGCVVDAWKLSKQDSFKKKANTLFTRGASTATLGLVGYAGWKVIFSPFYEDFKSQEREDFLSKRTADYNSREELLEEYEDFIDEIHLVSLNDIQKFLLHLWEVDNERAKRYLNSLGVTDQFLDLSHQRIKSFDILGEGNKSRFLMSLLGDYLEEHSDFDYWQDNEDTLDEISQYISNAIARSGKGEREIENYFAKRAINKLNVISEREQIKEKLKPNQLGEFLLEKTGDRAIIQFFRDLHKNEDKNILQIFDKAGLDEGFFDDINSKKNQERVFYESYDEVIAGLTKYAEFQMSGQEDVVINEQDSLENFLSSLRIEIILH